MERLRFLFLALLAGTSFAYGQVSAAPVIVAQISDTHLDEPRAPHAAANLRLAVQMINARHPHAVVLTGDIAETAAGWEEAKSILQDLTSPIYYVPGNHDVHTADVDKYRVVFGSDYYAFSVRNIDFAVIDSQLLGNYEHYDAKIPPPLPSATELESQKMLQWLKNYKRGRITIGLQHIPPVRDGDFPPDTKPYWVMSDPYRSQEMQILHELGIRHMLVGHWHDGRVFDWEGITWHVAPATSWLPWGGELGFAVHTITQDGTVKTEFVHLPGAQP